MNRCPQLSICRRLRSGVSNLHNCLQILDAPRPESSVPDRLWDWWNEDPPQRWQVDHWRSHEPVTSHTENQQNRDGNRWNSWNASNDWDWWTCWSIRGDDERWSSWPPILLRMSRKGTSDKSLPPEWDGSEPEKTWREHRFMLKQRLSTTDIPLEKHGNALVACVDWKCETSHFTLPR